MCGIAGAIVEAQAPEVVLKSLRKLEYRGYDSAGMSLISEAKIETFKEAGKIDNLAASLPSKMPMSSVAIGHTRWATHGKPSKINSHPHEAAPISLVHNGIISNADTLRQQLAASGVRCVSDTDTEVIVRLLAVEMDREQTALEAMENILPKLEGAYAFAFIEQGRPDTIYFARMNSPLVIGKGDKWMVASDVSALDPGVTEVCYPSEGDRGFISAQGGLFLLDQDGSEAVMTWSRVSILQSDSEKGDHRTFMMKEILEQPSFMRAQVDQHFQTTDFASSAVWDFSKTDRIDFAACGTAHYACQVGARWFSELAGIESHATIASEAEFTGSAGNERLGILVSQSGETADTIAAADQMKKIGMPLLSLVNAANSSLERSSSVTVNIAAGPEIGVASTKAFTAQLASLLRLALLAGVQRGHLSQSYVQEIIDGIQKLPDQMAQYLQGNRMQEHALLFDHARSAIILGKHAMLPLANEAALKIKECSYIHTQGYPAGELKHGPIALIEEGFPVVALCPTDRSLAKMTSAIEEVTARGARVLVITDGRDLYTAGQPSELVPDCHPVLRPILYALPVQMLAHFVAERRGLDVDRPRNLAKSVTVT